MKKVRIDTRYNRTYYIPPLSPIQEAMPLFPSIAAGIRSGLTNYRVQDAKTNKIYLFRNGTKIL